MLVLRRLNKIDYVLWWTFKLCLPLGVAVLVLGTVIAGLLHPHETIAHVPRRISAAAEMVMALGCLSLACAFLLEGYVFARGFARSIRFTAGTAVANTAGAILLGSGGVTLCVLAIRDWVRA